MPNQMINASVVTGIRQFLEALNSSGAKPIEQLSPQDARQVLTDAQISRMLRTVCTLTCPGSRRRKR